MYKKEFGGFFTALRANKSQSSGVGVHLVPSSQEAEMGES